MSVKNSYLQFIRRFHGEVLSVEYAVKKTQFKQTNRLMIWGAISVDGPE